MHRTRVLALSLMLLVSSFALGQQNPPGIAPAQPATPGVAMTAEQDRAQIQQIVRQLNQAALNNDASFYDRVLASGYRAVNPQGDRQDKDDIVDAHRDADIKYESVQDRDQDIQINGDTAIERSTSDVRGVYKGHRFDGTYASTRTFQRQSDGSWRIVNFEVRQVK